MTDEKYQGWKNRETWATSLWLNNDEGLYNTVIEFRDEIIDNIDEDENVESGIWNREEAIKFRLADRIKEFIEDELKELRDEGNKELQNMFDDIGSLYRVDYEEVAEGFIEE